MNVVVLAQGDTVSSNVGLEAALKADPHLSRCAAPFFRLFESYCSTSAFSKTNNLKSGEWRDPLKTGSHTQPFCQAHDLVSGGRVPVVLGSS
jgi:hypothetical protein